MSRTDERAGSSPTPRLPYGPARDLVFWMVVAAGAIVIAASTIQVFTADPSEGEGWIGGVIEGVFAGGPLIPVAIGLRSRARGTARRTAVASLLLALAVGFVLVMQVLDPNETNLDRFVQGAALIVYLSAFAVELPAFGGHWP